MSATAAGPVEGEVDGHTVKLGLLSVDDSMALLSQLAKLVGPGMAEASGDANLVTLIGKVFCSHSPAEVQALTKKLLRGCIFDGKPLFTDAGQPVHYDAAFRGNLGLLFKTLAFALKANLGDFTGPLAPIWARFLKLMGSRAAQAAGANGSTYGTSGPSGEWSAPATEA